MGGDLKGSEAADMDALAILGSACVVAPIALIPENPTLPGGIVLSDLSVLSVLNGLHDPKI
jgi:hypothetical protein